MHNSWFVSVSFAVFMTRWRRTFLISPTSTRWITTPKISTRLMSMNCYKCSINQICKPTRHIPRIGLCIPHIGLHISHRPTLRCGPLSWWHPRDWSPYVACPFHWWLMSVHLDDMVQYNRFPLSRASWEPKYYVLDHRLCHWCHVLITVQWQHMLVLQFDDLVQDCSIFSANALDI